ncbi:hypothetical protein OPQ81_000004 [Rhizoctonia solani]|nr:hypothetical protein OPQ81_000004 [Rhizoctonia solani]
MRQMVCALVDFMYCAQAPSLTRSDLVAMDNDLCIFHQHKLLLIGPFYEDDGEDPFKAIAKLHILQHWTHSIHELGTLDGFNTEVPEHLHIEYAKVPWQVSNKVKPMKQMITYIQCQEVIHVHWGYLNHYLVENGNLADTEEANETNLEVMVKPELLGDVEMAVKDKGRIIGLFEGAANFPEPVYYPNPVQWMAKMPTVGKLPIQDVVADYLASNMLSNTTDFLAHHCLILDHNILISPGNRVNIWHKLYLYHNLPCSLCLILLAAMLYAQACHILKNLGSGMSCSTLKDQTVFMSSFSVISLGFTKCQYIKL